MRRIFWIAIVTTIIIGLAILVLELPVSPNNPQINQISNATQNQTQSQPSINQTSNITQNQTQPYQANQTSNATQNQTQIQPTNASQTHEFNSSLSNYVLSFPQGTPSTSVNVPDAKDLTPAEWYCKSKGYDHSVGEAMLRGVWYDGCCRNNDTDCIRLPKMVDNYGKLPQ